MSRTYRKPAFAVEYSREDWIKSEIAYHARRPYTHVRVYFTEEENEAYYAQQVAEYEERCKAARRNYWWYLENVDRWNEFAERRYREAIGRYPIRRSIYRLVKVDQPVEDAIAEANAYYDRVTRDGWGAETTQRSGYKGDAKKTVRRANRKFCQDVLADRDWENKPYPIGKLGNAHRWDWW